MLLQSGFDDAQEVVEDLDPVFHVLLRVCLHVECSGRGHYLQHVFLAGDAVLGWGGKEGGGRGKEGGGRGREGGGGGAKGEMVGRERGRVG